MDELYDEDVTVYVTNEADTFYIQTIDGVNYVGDSTVVIVQDQPDYVIVDSSYTSSTDYVILDTSSPTSVTYIPTSDSA